MAEETPLPGKASKRRNAVDVDKKPVTEILKGLPMRHVVNAKFELFPYAKSQGKNDMQRAPAWEAIHPYINAMSQLMDITGGVGVTHKSMKLAVAMFCEEQGLCEKLGKDEPERGAYRLRVMLNQMLNHKQQDRAVPSAWKAKFGALFEKLSTSAVTSGSDPEKRGPVQDAVETLDSSDDECQIVEAIPLGVLQSDDPVLHALLNPSDEEFLPKHMHPVQCHQLMKGIGAEAGAAVRRDELYSGEPAPKPSAWALFNKKAKAEAAALAKEKELAKKKGANAKAAGRSAKGKKKKPKKQKNGDDTDDKPKTPKKPVKAVGDGDDTAEKLAPSKRIVGKRLPRRLGQHCTSLRT